jgi:hypothetical protein
MEHKRANEAYIISHRGARSRGYKRREGARARARERERERESLGASVSVSVSTYWVNVSPRLSLCEPQRLCCLCGRERCPLSVVTSALLRALGRPWTSPFIDTRRCPAVQWGVAMCYRGWRRSALSPVHELTWPSEKCIEPCRSTAVGAAWILLTLSCFRRRLRAIRRHGLTRGTIITCYRSNLRWDTGLVPS